MTRGERFLVFKGIYKGKFPKIGPYATNMGKWGIPGKSFKNGMGG